jgi:L-2-hydroxyglutarate oxidase
MSTAAGGSADHLRVTAETDLCVIGAGIVGLATARALQLRHPGAHVVVLDKEATVAAHQTGHNSGVIHSGIYYRPASAKARLVARGRALLEEFCAEHGIHREYCGKVIVATSDEELPRLRRLEELAAAHGLKTHRLDRSGLREIEPHAEGLAALHVPATGIIDFAEVCRALAAEVTDRGGEVRTAAAVVGISTEVDRVELRLGDGTTVRAKRAVNCGGLHSDRLARLAGARPDVRITPFRGEYHHLRPHATGLVRNLIYPVPDPAFPFLGVHFTRDVHGGVHAGPNAVLALSREGYRWGAVSLTDLAEMVWDPGLWRLMARHWRTGLGEMHRSLSLRALTRALQRLVPDLAQEDLEPAPAGVRAQALRSDGELLDDFAFAESGPVLHVLNAPSPAATASLAIGEEIASR